MQVQCHSALKQILMKIEFENSIRRLSILCHIPDIKSAWINPCYYIIVTMIIVSKRVTHPRYWSL